MSKRSFAEFSAQSPASQVLEHADELLRAAQALKHDLEAFRANPESEGDVNSVLRCHNQRIQETARSLDQDQVSSSFRPCFMTCN